jgi:ribosomal protein S18 acetylase RimI-like enzyme
MTDSHRVPPSPTLPEHDFEIRNAIPEDGTVLAELMNLAGEGLPSYLWSQLAGPGEDAMAVGARRVASVDGGFSYRHAHVLLRCGQVAGMLLGYRLPEHPDMSALEGCPKVVLPLLELEAQVPGSWYVNAVATMPGQRGLGVGTRLMQLAEQLALESAAAALSLIVAAENTGASRLYERLGYVAVARRPIIAFPGCTHRGDWVLMRKPLECSHYRART